MRILAPRRTAVLLSIAATAMTGLAQAQTCQVRIGAVGPLSGAASAWGLAMKEGAEFAAAEANANGGLPMGQQKCKVSVVSYDAQYTAAGGAAAANYLASQNVHATLGPVGSPETTGFRPVAARSFIINFSSSYMRDVIGPEFPLAFHALQAPVTWGPLLVKTASEKFKLKTVMIVGPNDQGGTDASTQLQGIYGAAGIKATTDYYQRGTTNFAPLATRIMSMNPDAVEISTVPPGDAAILVKQLLEAGFDGVLGSLGGNGLKPIEDGAGGIGNLKSVYWLETSPVDAPGIVQMKADYQKLFNKESPANPLFAVFAMAGEVLLEGISAAGTDSDGEKIATALRSLTPSSRYMGKAGWRGTELYKINQELTFPPGLGMIVDGRKQPTTVVPIPAE